MEVNEQRKTENIAGLQKFFQAEMLELDVDHGPVPDTKDIWFSFFKNHEVKHQLQVTHATLSDYALADIIGCLRSADWKAVLATTPSDQRALFSKTAFPT